MTLNVLEAKETDLELSLYAQLSAIKGTQFGRDVYSSAIKFKDLEKFMSVFPNVQRLLNKRKVNSIKKYIISGIEQTGTINMRFFPAITATCRTSVFYDERTARMGIDVNESKLSINDGQHRFTAINQTLEYLESEYVKSKDKYKTARLRKLIDEAKDMMIPVIIFAGLTEKEEKQLFHDTNNLAQRPSRSANIRLNQTDLFSKMAREVALENRYLKYYGVEMDKMSIHGSNENTILLTTVYEMIKEILGAEWNADINFLTKDNYEHYKAIIKKTLDELFYALPSDINVSGKYLIEKAYTLKSIAKFISNARNHLDLMLTDEELFAVIKSVDWTMNLDFWGQYNAIPGVKGNIVFGGGMHGAAKSVYQALVDAATKQ